MKCRFALFSVLLLCSVAALIAQTPQTLMTQPSLSPDGSTIAFSAGSDIWTAPSAGGTAHILIADPGFASRPLYSPDGRWLAFQSTRTGGVNGNIYLLQLSTGEIRRLTYSDGVEWLDGWSPDARWVYFSSGADNIPGIGADDIYRIHATDGTPMVVAGEPYRLKYDAAPAPDGTVVFCAMGLPGNWWNEVRNHMNQSEIWRLDPATGSYKQLVAGGAKQIWPMLTPNGRDLYFMSNRSGNENLWAATLGPGAAAPRQITHFTSGRLLWPTIASNGKTIVFERDFGIWKLDLASRQATALPIHLEGVPASPPAVTKNITAVDDFDVSPDGKKIAFEADGNIFAGGTDPDSSIPVRLTHAQRHVQIDPIWSPNSRTLVYTSDRDGPMHLFRYDFATHAETKLTDTAGNDDGLQFSPDGKSLLFLRNRNQIMLMNLADGSTRELVHGAGTGSVAFSPDGQYVAYIGRDGPFNNVFIVPTTGGASRQVTFLANRSAFALSWSPDAKFLIYETGHQGEPSHIARVDLVPPTAIYNEDRLQALFQEQPNSARGGRGGRGRGATTTPPPATQVEYTNIKRRLSFLPLTNAYDPTISPDGKWLAYGKNTDGRDDIYLYSLAPEPPGVPPPGGRNGRRLTTTPGDYYGFQFSADSQQLYFNSGDRVVHVSVSGGAPRPVNFRATLDVDFNQDTQESFDQAWRSLRDRYRDAAMNGVDWDAVRARFAPIAAGARAPGDMRWALQEMIGELKSSHMSLQPGSSLPVHPPTVGRLGVFFDRARYESAGQFCLAEIVPQSPADQAGLQPGDCLTAVNGVTLQADSNFDQLLDGTVGHKVSLTVARQSPGPAPINAAALTLPVQPVNTASLQTTIYRAWVDHNRALVDKLSNGALGYVHMAVMEPAWLDQFYLDLDSENLGRKGVVMDIRGNSGGLVSSQVLDALSRRAYLTFVPRDQPGVNERLARGQRALELPTILLTNERSVSDAEIFTEGYRVLGLGKVVGEPTAGAVIGTGSRRLRNGMVLGMPGTRSIDHLGKDMEGVPRPVDLEVAYPPGTWATGRDPQLEAAVKLLLAQVNAVPKPSIATGTKDDGGPR